MLTDAATGLPDVGLADKVPESGSEVEVESFMTHGAAGPPNERPKWRAMIRVTLDRMRRPILVDTGCTHTCMSYNYFMNNPYLKKFFTPRQTCGVAINGSDVIATGDVSLKFQLAGEDMSMRCRVTKGLLDPIVLGWDWFAKYNIILDAGKGMLSFGNGKQVPLIESEVPLLGALY